MRVLTVVRNRKRFAQRLAVTPLPTVSVGHDGVGSPWQCDRVFILNVTDIGAAQAMLEALTLGKAHLMTFDLYPIGPLNSLCQALKTA